MADKLVSADYLKKRFAYYAAHSLPLEGYCYFQAMKEVDAAPAVEPVHQTAGEMFRERGYYPKKSADNMTEYTDGEWSFKATKDGGFELWANYNGLKVSQKTILACARLIEELEAENGKAD